MHRLLVRPFTSATGFKPQRHTNGVTRMTAVTVNVHGEVVLTREKGKNKDLMAALQQRSIPYLELPLIEAGPGPDRHLLLELLKESTFDYIILTSPEAATVFLAGWKEAGRPQVRIASVGAGTTKLLLRDEDAQRLQPVFEPSRANAVHLSAELPVIPGGDNTVLYPASVKAGSDLQNGLAARGFSCTRIHTYNTLPAQAVDEDAMLQASRAAVVTFASPSAVKAWVQLSQQVVGGVPDIPVACIGSTSAKAAEAQGLGPIFYPQDPGLPGFVESIIDALQARQHA